MLATNIRGTVAVNFSKNLTARLDQAFLQMAAPVHEVPNDGGSAAASLKIVVLLRVVTCTKLSVIPCNSGTASCERTPALNCSSVASVLWKREH